MIDPRKIVPALLVFTFAALALRGKNVALATYCDQAAGTTLTRAQLATMVKIIYQAFYGSLFTEDEQVIIHTIGQCNSDADVYALACAYGNDSPFTHPARDLFQAVNFYFSTSQIADLNARLSAKGINVIFI